MNPIEPPNRRQVVSGLFVLAVVAALVLSELACREVRDFWISHPILAALTASTAVVAVTAVIARELLRRRDALRRQAIVGAAYRELSTDAFKFYWELIALLGLRRDWQRYWDVIDELRANQTPSQPVLSGDFHQKLDRTLNSRRRRQKLSRLIYRHSEALGQSIARWAPIMLLDSQLIDSLERFSSLRDSLIQVNNGLDAAEVDAPDWMPALLTMLDFYFLFFSDFDTERRRILGEPRLFSEDPDRNREIWGLPPDGSPTRLPHLPAET